MFKNAEFVAPNLLEEPKQANDATFANSLGLSMFQETHRTVADVDRLD